ncbi:MAG TPA: tetratricopeptide repeat protein [Fimbriimonadaceae bacterium]|nr:tetratricopeptide repeat protein [Fimbriimonadaceae bacterium]
MDRNELRELISQVMAEAAQAQSGSALPTCEAAFEERLPQMLQARYAVEPSGEFIDATIALLLESAPVEAPDFNGHMKLRRSASNTRWRPAYAFALAAGLLLLAVIALWRPPQPQVLVKDQPAPKGNERLVPDGPQPEDPAVKIERHERPRRPQVAERRETRPRSPEGTAVPPAPLVAAGSLTSTMGDVLIYAPGAKEPAIAKPGTVIQYGSRIETGDIDKAVVRFEDGTTLRMDFNTALEIPPIEGEVPPRPPRVRQISGVIAAIVTPSSAPFEIETQPATARVLGTSFNLELDPKGIRTTLRVVEGRVEFGNKHGTVVVEAMRESIADEHSLPSEPKRMAQMREVGVYQRRQVIIGGRLESNASESLHPLARSLAKAGVHLEQEPDGTYRLVVQPGSRADRELGLQTGDSLISINGRRVQDAAAIPPEGPLQLLLQREANLLSAELEQIELRVAAPMRMPAHMRRRFYSATWEGLYADRRRAIRAFEEMVATTPSAPIHHSLGLLYELNDQYGSAIRSHKMSVEFDPLEPVYRNALGMALLMIGNAHRAIEELEVAFRLDHGPMGARNLLLALAFHGEHQRAAEVASQALERFNRCELWDRWSECLALRGDFAGSLSAAERAVALDPRDQGHVRRRAIALGFLGRYEEAIKVWRDLLEVERGSARADVLYELANLLAWGRDPAEGERLWREAIEVNPSFTYALNNLGFFLRIHGRFEEAEQFLHRAVRATPDLPNPYYHLAMVLRDKGQLREAALYSGKAAELAIANAQYALHHARVLVLLGRVKEARRYADRAHRLLHFEPQVKTSIAWVLLAEGSVSQADEMINAVLGQGGWFVPRDSADAWYLLGVIRERQGQMSAAEDAYRKALIAYPHHLEATMALKRLGG